MYLNSQHRVLSVVRLLIGGAYLAAALPKLQQPYDFLSDIYKYQLTGRELSKAVAIVLPWSELVLAICLLGGVMIGGALLVSALLSAMFVIAQGSAITRGLNIACGCFGGSISSEPVGYVTIVRAFGMLIASILGYLVWRKLGQPASNQVPEPPQSAA